MLTAAYVLLWAALVLYGLRLLGRAGWAGWAGTAGTVAAWLLLTVALAARGLAAGHWPLTNRYEFSLCFVCALLAVYLLLEGSAREQRFGLFVILAALAVFTTVWTRPVEERTIHPLVPALRSMWLPIHGLTAAVGYGACGVAGGISLMLLLRPRGPWGERWPEVEEIERVMMRAAGLGFPWLTLSILSGAIWAEAAWGRYWGWDPKETWSLVVWLGYLLLFHLRSMRGWRGRRLAWVGLGAFLLLFWGLIGFPVLVRAVRLESLHGY